MYEYIKMYLHLHLNIYDKSVQCGICRQKQGKNRGASIK